MDADDADERRRASATTTRIRDDDGGNVERGDALASSATGSTNPFDVDAAELEARARRTAGGRDAETRAGADDATREDAGRRRSTTMTRDRDRDRAGWNGTSSRRRRERRRARGGGRGEALDNGSYHASAGMSYGDLLAPPPSYADSVMYAQPEIQPARDVGANAAGGTTTTVFLDGDDGAGDEETLQIWVSDPKIEADTSAALVGKRVTHYKITTRTTIPSYIHKEVVVWRRFRDFVALDARLSALHRGYFIPPRPEKTVVSSTGDNFIAERAIQLQHYLNRIASHSKLRSGIRFESSSLTKIWRRVSIGST